MDDCDLKPGSPTTINVDPADGEKTVNQPDFVLIWSQPENIQNKSPEQKTEDEKEEKRKAYFERLQKTGLHVVVEENHATIKADDIKLLQQYAEILKMRMPLAEELRWGKKKVKETETFSLGWLQWKLSSSSGWEKKKVELTLPYSRGRKNLFKEGADGPSFFTPSVRSRIVEFILRRGFTLKEEDSTDGGETEDEFQELLVEEIDDFYGLDRLLSEKIFEAAFPLHEENKRQDLLKKWGNLRKWREIQPLDDIRDYYGEKVALYFAWLGYYNTMLLFPTIVGILSFIYGLATFSTDIPSAEVCSGPMRDTVMCPICDGSCSCWKLEEACFRMKSRYLFDNVSTVFYAVFMALWSAFFLEGWKRYSAGIRYKWGDVDQTTPEAEHPRPEYLRRLQNEVAGTRYLREHPKRPSYWRMRLPINIASWTSVLFLIILACIGYCAVIIYRTSMVVTLAWIGDKSVKEHHTTIITTSGAVINSMLIFIFNQLYGWVARKLTEKEWRRTQTDFDNSLNMKIYLFQSVNSYGSILYVAFIKGAFSGQSPNQYYRVAGYRQEECAPGGCYGELVIHMATIFLCMQFKTTVVKYSKQWVTRRLQLCGFLRSIKKENPVEDYNKKDWREDVLFYEYLEMIIQFGFITVFACIFPLAPLFALINNDVDMRLAARRFLKYYRRPVVQKVQNIGVWFGILITLTQLSIVINAFVIGYTSDFIPKLVFRFFYNGQQDLSGYINFSLSTFNFDDLDKLSVGNTPGTDQCQKKICHYPGYNNNGTHPDGAYKFSDTFYHIWCARLLFIVCYILLISFLVETLRWLIPGVPKKLRWQMERERFKSTQVLQKNVQAGTLRPVRT